MTVATTIREVRSSLYALRDRLPIFTITDHPKDFPDAYVARLHLTLPAPEALPLIFKNPDLEAVRAVMRTMGLVKLDRSPEDDPVILETWL